MNKFLAVCFLLFGSVAFAQVPNCQINFGPWTDVNQTPPSANLYSQCTYWVFTYQITGFTAVSLQFESATGVNGGPGTFGAFSGTLTSGSNPSTSVACSTPANCTATFTGTVGWYRMRLVSHTGSGTIQGTLQGYKTGVTLGGLTPPGGSPCPGTAATPCVVDGPTAAGSPPTTAPVYVAGNDGTNLQPIKTDTSGRPNVVGAGADAAALTGNPVRVCGSDATNCRTFLVDTSGRLVNVGAAAAGAAIAGAPLLTGLGDGTNAQYSHSASLANYPTTQTLTAVNSIGAQIEEKGARWTATGFPAAGTQATASIAAEAGVRHVMDCIGFSATASGVTTAAQVNLVVRDGATGAGTVIWRYTLAYPAAAAAGVVEIPPFSFCGLNLVGTTNTAMTVEFSAGAANLQEQTNLSGFNVN